MQSEGQTKIPFNPLNCCHAFFELLVIYPKIILCLCVNKYWGSRAKCCCLNDTFRHTLDSQAIIHGLATALLVCPQNSVNSASVSGFIHEVLK